MGLIDSDEKITALLVRLNRLTSLGEIHWQVAEAPRSLSRGTDDYFPFFASARYKGQRFALYEQRFQTYDGENDRFYWSDQLVLAILDDQERVLWSTTRGYSALSDLIETVRRKVANIDGILDYLLKDEDPPRDPNS